MPRTSSGLLMYRKAPTLQVLLVHPGGPFWASKDLGAWSIPKGEVEPDEDLLATAQREFAEELGFPPTPPFHPLGQIRQKAGKIVHAWAFQGDCDPTQCKSNTYRIEWPPKSGQWASYPEVDRAEFFDLPTAREKINPAQVPFLDTLEAISKKDERGTQ
jgi:predicted NUDIX family NTP pyrophosphohydrolase